MRAHFLQFIDTGRLVTLVFLLALLTGCVTEPKVDPGQIDIPSPPAQPDLCVYGKRIKGVAEIVDKKQLSSNNVGYVCRFYPGDTEFELVDSELMSNLTLGLELMAVRLSLLSGPAHCPDFDYELVDQASHQ